MPIVEGCACPQPRRVPVHANLRTEINFNLALHACTSEINSGLSPHSDVCTQTVRGGPTELQRRMQSTLACKDFRGNVNRRLTKLSCFVRHERWLPQAVRRDEMMQHAACKPAPPPALGDAARPRGKWGCSPDLGQVRQGQSMALYCGST